MGPNLYGVVGRPKASEAGFNYSAAMKAKGGDWSFEDLNQFLTSPRGFIPGTAMSFAGLPRDQQRLQRDYRHQQHQVGKPNGEAAFDAGPLQPVDHWVERCRQEEGDETPTYELA